MALDLTREFPRSPFAELGGYPWLARLIDKVRAKQAGTLGDYTPYPCGGDQRFLKALGLDPAALEAEIQRGATEDEIVAWVRSHQSPQATEGLAEYRRSLLRPVPEDRAHYLEEAKKALAKDRPDLDLSGVDNFQKLICVEEGYSIPQTV